MALRRSTSQVESIASSLIKKLEQLAKEREEEAEIAEKDGYDETIGTQFLYTVFVHIHRMLLHTKNNCPV